MDDTREQVRRAAQAVHRADASRAEAIRKRDDAILAALDSGVTWREIETLAGLTPNAVTLAIRRARKRRVG